MFLADLLDFEFESTAARLLAFKTFTERLCMLNVSAAMIGLSMVVAGRPALMRAS